jgi:hypothetical protein
MRRRRAAKKLERMARRIEARPWLSACALREQVWRGLRRWDEARRADTAARLACLPPLRLLARALNR